MTASRIPIPAGSDFTIDNLPYGVLDRDGALTPAVAIGEHVLDLGMVSAAGLLPGSVTPSLASGCLNAFMALGRGAWQETREALVALLTTDSFDRLPDGAVIPMAEARLSLPFDTGDYVDFYSSIEHATNLGRMFRPDAEPLLPNWRHLPVGYHGRAGTVVVSGTPIRRPRGQVVAGDGPPMLAPTAALDIELEVGFVIGPGSTVGEPIPISRVRDHVFGLVLVNDWSARDIQRWEYQPLGPFLGKSFATTISPWVVTIDALEPFMTAPPQQDPPPLDYLKSKEEWAIDLDLEVGLASAEMTEAQTISRTNFSGMYWTIAQQLTHATVNGANASTGDLYASGTISGADPGSCGSLIELTWNGRDPIDLTDGSQRRFLKDGDTVTLRGWCEAEGTRVGFGECVGTVLPAL